MTAVVLMGVSGSGKTTVGELLASSLGWSYFDADDFHPAANVAKMRSGIPLQDADRWPWLDAINDLLKQHTRRGEHVVLGCSALKQVYRDRIADQLEDVVWVYLKGDFDLIRQRLAARKGHYMPASLLQSQFATLEEPQNAIVIDIHVDADAIRAAIERALANRKSG